MGWRRLGAVREMPGAFAMASVVSLNRNNSSGGKDLYGIGEIPPLGHVPEKMHAWAIRKERHGPPESSFQLEVVPTWPIGEDEVLVRNHNGFEFLRVFPR